MANKPVCKIDGCDKAVAARGWCSRHYHKWKNHGSPYAGRSTEDGAGIKLLGSLVGRDGEECVDWPYSRTSRGYGQAWVNGTCLSAHRLMCEMAHGAPPFPNAMVAHSCDNPACVNPNHLRWATHAENMDDKMERERTARGEGHGCSKLTEEQARFAFSQKGKISQRQLAKMFNVSRHTISDIHRKAAWKHIHASS